MYQGREPPHDPDLGNLNKENHLVWGHKLSNTKIGNRQEKGSQINIVTRIPVLRA
jgi:hypothetical protein